MNLYQKNIKLLMINFKWIIFIILTKQINNKVNLIFLKVYYYNNYKIQALIKKLITKILIIK